MAREVPRSGGHRVSVRVFVSQDRCLRTEQLSVADVRDTEQACDHRGGQRFTGGNFNSRQAQSITFKKLFGTVWFNNKKLEFNFNKKYEMRKSYV